MTLRARIATTAAVAVAVAVVLAFAGLYLVTTRTLVGEVDRSLTQLAHEVDRTLAGMPRHGGFMGGVRPGRFGGAGGYVQVVQADGRVRGDAGGDRLDLPVSDRTLAVAAGQAGPFLSTVDVDGQSFRVLTAPTRFDVAVQVARPLDEVGATLAALRRRLVVFGLFGVGLAAALGTLVARRAVRPVDRLTGLAEEVAATRDLSRRIALDGHDEVGRLAAAFNTMLAALEQARTAQEQLVADASHELRTPLTSLRTNIEVLARGDRLDPAARRALLDDLVLQLDEFGRLVTGLVELARGDRPARGVVPVRLDDLVARVVTVARTHAHVDAHIDLDAAPTTVLAEEDRVERAVANLVDNAVKYAGADGPIEVTVADGSVTVRDHGAGIPEADLPHVFDRFYRAVGARAAPGSGLGLSIVAQVAAAHGGTVTADNAPDGGAVVRLTLPTTPPPSSRPRAREAVGGFRDGAPQA